MNPIKLPKMKRIATLAFVREESGQVTSIGVLNLRTTLATDGEVKEALVEAVTHWVKTTKEGRDEWRFSGQDFNIGDLAGGGVLENVDLRAAMEQRDLEYLTSCVASCERAYPYDEVLVDTESLNASS